MHVNVKDAPGTQVAPGVVERTLYKPSEGEQGPTVKHYVLTKGGMVEFGDPLTEYQHYIVQGCAAQNQLNGSLLHQDTAWFVPCNAPWGGEPARSHSICHAGEGEVRLLTVAYKVDRPAFRWAKSRSRNIYEVPQPHSSGRLLNYVQIFSEEEHAVMGALRMHGVDVQTNPKGVSLSDHRNPEEIMYVLKGKGVSYSGGETQEVSAGSLVYTAEGEVHGIRSVEETMEYLVIEFIDHAQMWTQRGKASA